MVQEPDCLIVRPFFLPLFTNVSEVEFSELRLYSILGSFAKRFLRGPRYCRVGAPTIRPRQGSSYVRLTCRCIGNL